MSGEGLNNLLLSNTVLENICCPICKSVLNFAGDIFVCTNISCNSIFPIIEGIPILINESNSLFALGDYLNRREVLLGNMIKNYLSSFLPKLGKNIKAAQNYSRLARMLLERTDKPQVLVLGGGGIGQGMKDLMKFPSIELVETDVAVAARTKIIVDGHDIPFSDRTFYGVIAQAVLEHVVDPYRCVSEIHRVLKDGGLVYIEAPFMQQVHGGGYDFTRYTHLGLRRLLRDFKEISSGVCVGPGTALAWSFEYFFLSFTANKSIRLAIKAAVRIGLFWLKYFDYISANKPGGLDAASAYYFLGEKASVRLSDKELMKQYRGGQNFGFKW